MLLAEQMQKHNRLYLESGIVLKNQKYSSSVPEQKPLRVQ